MVKKLADASLVNYLPYKGVELTAAGEKIARRVLRHRRMWEVFLVNHLDLSHTEADALACRMEHITSDEVANRLYTFLGEPDTSPQGKPIPTVNGERLVSQVRPLSRLNVGEQIEVIAIEADEAICAFLNTEGVCSGRKITILAKSSTGSMLISLPDRQISISEPVATKVLTRTQPAPS